jgi:hypothetical protein
MSGCTSFRKYVGAVADGELDLVPEPALRHIAACPRCSNEVDAHREVNRKLRLATVLGSVKGARSARRVRALVAVAAMLLVAALGTSVWRYATGEDRVAAAATVADLPPQFRSSDSQEIGDWCVRASNRPMPEIALDSLTPVGARMDRRAGGDIVTVTYTSSDGARVAVAWLDSTPASDGRIESRSINGHTVLVVAGPAGTAVVMGRAAMPVLWETAVAIEQGSAQRSSAA